ncbi:O-acetyl-ADP-ribose deacetylase [Phytohalomonas tamaricis]|uniref:O-acetyl-ADP-ribose deacetylase n=1 Tax=Phytohalomonas tamaricis TaxID=2081032 RepID=UPI000D0B0ADC|nr:O-acetyl-ADP-ribose deacetylase [Phytohalomonas tamaricis]
MHTTLFDGQLTVMVGDITQLEADVIVNAANSSLLGGGGVDGAIHRAAGSKLLQACQAVREHDWPEGLPTGEVALTPGFDLPARYIIHTVGPVYSASQDRSTELAACYRNALALADIKNMRSIAFPAISTGIYGYPREAANRIILKVMEEELPRRPELTVILCFFNETDADLFFDIAKGKR